MIELLKNYQVLLLIVLTIVFILSFVFLAVKYVKSRGLEGIRSDVYKLFLKAEHVWTQSGQGEQRMKWVIHKARGLLPSWLKFLITEELLKKVIQFWFDGIKDILDDGKLNKSIDETCDH
jgi:hypothetical protein